MSADLDLPALQRVVAEAPPCTLVATCDDAHYPDACWYARIRLEHARGLTVATLQPDWCEGPDGTRHELTRAQAQALATYIATFDPPTVRALLTELARLRADITRIAAAYGIDAGNAEEIIRAIDQRGERAERELARLRRVEAAANTYRARYDAFLDDDSNENMDAMDAAEADLLLALEGPGVTTPHVVSEEVLFTFDNWQGFDPHPCKLITYSNGQRDVHAQTGNGHRAAIERARTMLAERGITVSENYEMIGPTGAYYSTSDAPHPPPEDQRMTTTNKYLAPAGHIFMCAACGKWGKDRMRIGDESCFIRAILLVGDEPRFDFIADEAGILQCTVVNEVVESQP